MHSALLALAFCALAAATPCTLTNRQTGEVIRGTLVRTTERENERILIVVDDGGKEHELPVAQWAISLRTSGTDQSPPARPPAPAPSPKPAGVVVVLFLREPIRSGPLVSAFKGAIQAALRYSPVAIVLMIDTPGGEIDAASEMSAILLSLKGPRTVAFVVRGKYGGAYSAGALLALSCDEIRMAPGTVIGAARPVNQEGEELPEKYVSAFAAQMRTVAGLKGHSQALATAMVDEDAEVWLIEVGDKRLCVFAEEKNRLSTAARAEEKTFKELATVSSRGKLLTLTDEEAARFGLAKSCASVDEIAASFNAATIARPGESLRLANVERIIEEQRRRMEEEQRRAEKRREEARDYIIDRHQDAAKWYNRALTADPSRFTYAVNTRTGLFVDGGVEWRRRSDTCLDAAKRARECINNIKKVSREVDGLNMDLTPSRNLELKIDSLIEAVQADYLRRGFP